MKSLIVLSFLLVGGVGVLVGPVPALWTARDARPEAVATGAALLLLASVVRHGREYWRAK